MPINRQTDTFGFRLLGWNPQTISGSIYEDAAWSEFRKLARPMADTLRSLTPRSVYHTHPHMRDNERLEIYRDQWMFRVTLPDEVTWARLVVDGYDEMIYPTTAPRLLFRGEYDGARMALTGVMGQQANPFPSRAIQASREIMRETSRRMAEAVLGKFGSQFRE